MAKRKTAKKKTKKSVKKKSKRTVAKRKPARAVRKKTAVKKTAKRGAKKPVKAKRTAAKTRASKPVRPRSAPPKGVPTPPRLPVVPPPQVYPTAPPLELPRSPMTPVSTQTGDLPSFGESLDDGEDSDSIRKTFLSEKQLREFKQLLLDKRAEIASSVQHLTNEALNRQRDGGGDHSNMPIHMADLGSDNWEQEFTLGLAENERSTLREIDEALERIETKTFGICMATHQPIGLARLQAQPWTKYSIEYARQRDEGRIR